MNLAGYFDRILVINLPARTDRLRGMEQELNRAGLPLSPGKIEVFPAIRPDDAAGFPNIGVRGCLLSHLTIYRQARENGWNRILVMEDDLTMSSKIASHQGEIVAFLEKNPWDFAYLGHFLDLPARDLSSIGFERYGDPITTAHFYAINGRVLDPLIEFIEVLQTRPPGDPNGGPMHLDGALSWFRTHTPDVITWVANPSLGWQRSSRSDILPARWFDRVPVVRQIIASARSIKVRLGVTRVK